MAAAKKIATKKAKANPRNKKLYDEGMKVRKAVLGAAYVDNSMAGADDFMMSFQDITTEYCWGYAWTRPGLSKKNRSMLNLAMLAALNRGPELKLHINGALNNGLTKEEIKEILFRSRSIAASRRASTPSRPRAASSRTVASKAHIACHVMIVIPSAARELSGSAKVPPPVASG